MNAEAVAILGRLNLRIDPTITLNRLPISKQQMVEIAKSLSFDSEVLIMDEPTSALTESEIDELFTVIHTLRDRGVAIIYISHRLEELKHIVDRISIFRDGRSRQHGRVCLDHDGHDRQPHGGSEAGEQVPARGTTCPPTEKILEVRNIVRRGVLHDISFDLYRGEILGFAGLMGAGRSELARAIFGADPIDSGTVIMNGKRLSVALTLRMPSRPASPTSRRTASRKGLP